MTPTQLEIRAIAYVIVAAILFGCGVKVGMFHVQAQWNIDKLAQASVLAKAQADLNAALVDRTQLQQQVAKQNDDLKAKSDALVSSVTDSVRSVQAALRAGGLFAAMANPGGSGGTGAGPGSNSRLEQAFADVGASISRASTACLHDAREVTVIQAAAPKPAPPH
jgi:hypothetical protein